MEALALIFVTAAAATFGMWLGTRRAAAATRLRQFRVADELAQYRAFTRLLRTQSERIIGLSGDAAMTIAGGLRTIDDRATALATAESGDRRDAVLAVAEPVVGMIASLQFQDVTRQQLMFLCRLSVILDEHMAELARSLGDRRSLDRTGRFKELFDRALDDTVMTSQRNDHHDAAGLQLFESNGLAVEMFTEPGEER